MSWGGDVARAVAGAAGAAVVVAAVGSALRTVVLPRAVPVRLTAGVFGAVRTVYLARLGRSPTYARRDRVMASFAPVALLTTLAAWLVLSWAGYVAVLWALGGGPPLRAVELSGSSLTTLGFVAPHPAPLLFAAVTEAVVGLVLVALLITYLPSLYGSFSRREQLVTKLEVRAGRPPTGVAMLVRAWRLERFDLLPQVWSDWETWFVDVEESHTSFPALSFFRSPQPDHSWVTAAGAVLDAAALYASSVEAPRDIDAELCMRAGYLALRRVAGLFDLPYPADPQPGDPVAVTRDEYDGALRELAEAGVPLRADRDRAWRDFAGWRVNYDTVLVALAALTMAPYAPWSSDRSLTSTHGRR